MKTEEISDRYVTPCFVNRLEEYDGEINLRIDENMISNEFAVKLCLDHKMKSGSKVVKKELIVALRGEIYFVKFLINPEEDDVEPGVVLGSIMELYMMNRQHGRMILESVENGPLIWPSIEENGVTRPKKYSELSTMEAI
ncbi:hypothetical protein Tco_0845087 [Tanacetum coccineum]